MLTKDEYSQIIVMLSSVNIDDCRLAFQILWNIEDLDKELYRNPIIERLYRGPGFGGHRNNEDYYIVWLHLRTQLLNKIYGRPGMGNYSKNVGFE